MCTESRYPLRRLFNAITFFGLLLVLLSGSADAATCSYTNFSIGTEIVAVDGPNGNGEFHYVGTTVRCDGSGQVVYDNLGFEDPRDMGWILPSNLLSTAQATWGTFANMRIFMSGCNTHLLTVNKYGPSNKSIAGISMAAYPISTTPYIGVFQAPLHLQLGLNFSMAADPATGACMLRADSGLNAGLCVAGARNGFGSASANGTNPINPAWRGNKIQVETDYRGAGAYPLIFVRTYNSRASRVAGLTSGFDSAVTGAWTHTYQRSLQLFIPANNTGLNTVQSVAVSRSDGKVIVFNPSGSNWVAATKDTAETLTKMGDGTWRLVTAQDETETYSAAGKLTALTNRAGLTQSLSYDANGRLSQVADPFGRTLAFAYDTNSRLATLTDPAGNAIQFGYDSQGNLITVTYPGTQTRTYLYENASYPRALTGIVDENGQRFATYVYDSQGRAISSEHGATNSGIDKHSVAYNADGSATVTDALGSARAASYQTQFGTSKLANANQPAGAGCAPAARAITYDTSGFVASQTDFNGIQTTYVNNARGLETSRTEAAGTPLARTVTTAWHATLRQPTQIDEPGRRTTFTYDTSGNPLAKTVTDTASGIARTWTWTYNAQGQMLTADGPRTDVLDKTTYTYYATSTGSVTAGDLATVTDAQGYVTQVTAYDRHGRPLTIIDPNSVTTTLAYTPRGWLQSRTVAGQATTYTYDAVGQLTRVTLGDGSHTDYSYDAAHRLTSVTDTLGRAVDYTLDNAGNRIGTHWQNADASTAKSESAVMDALGRAQTLSDGMGNAAAQTFDANGNRTGYIDPKNQATAIAWDAHNRPIRVTDAAGGITTTSYDGLDRITGVVAPNGTSTVYTRDALDNLKTEVSADRGTTQATYDEAGNLKTRTDARGVVATYTYDALNRPLTVSYPSTGENLAYTWDSGAGCSNGVGRLCAVSDAVGSTRYAYDVRGNRVSETRVIGSLSLTTQYSYDAADRLTTLITAGGKVVSLTRDGDGQIQSVAAPVAGSSVTLTQSVKTNVLGETVSQTFGNGVTESRTYDTAGRPADVADTANGGSGGGDADVPTLPEWGALILGALLLGAGLRHGRANGPVALVLVSAAVGLLGMWVPGDSHADENLLYDANGNIVSRTGSNGTTTYTYDALDRLQNETGPAKNQSFTYDGNGNRLSDGSGNHTYAASSDRQATIAGQAVTLDAAGQITQARGLGFVWNQAGQLKEVHQTGPSGTLLATYDYDARGRRVRKVTTAAAPQGAGTTLYLYDPADRLLLETDGSGNPRVTYVWRDEVPVSLIVAGTPETVLYLETDHLNTPRVARNQAKTVVWRWESDAFGATLANEDPDGDGAKTTINLRFPGQYYDAESGLHYNFRRYYDPQGGRYLSPDPIGLAGGINQYLYGKANPLSYTDPRGENVAVVGGAAVLLVGGAIMSALPKPKPSDSAFPDAANDSKFGDRTCPPDCTEQKKLLDQTYIALMQREKAASILGKITNPLQWTIFWGKVKIYELQCGPYTPPFMDNMEKIQDFYGR